MKSAIEALREAQRAQQEHERRMDVQLSLLTNRPRDDRIHDMKTEQQIIDEAEQHFGPVNPGTLLEALEAFYMSGSADEVSGNVEAPTGHFYRVDRWIVTTDSQGFKSVTEHDTEITATYGFDVLESAYAEWDGYDGPSDVEIYGAGVK